MGSDGVREDQGKAEMSEAIRMHHITTELLSCGRVDPDEFRKAFEELGFWEEDFPADGFDEMCARFKDMGVAAWARFMDLTIAINGGELTELLIPLDDGREIIPDALIEAAALAPMEFETLKMDRAELRREAMRRLAAFEGDDGLSLRDL